MKPRASFLADTLAGLGSQLDAPSANEQNLITQLAALVTRMEAERLQLAVVGQFKRGKSTLLNALLGREVLPSGILPVTAIGTFLEAGPTGMTVIHRGGAREEVAPDNEEDLPGALARFVSEAGNPRNRLNVREVKVRLESPFLAEGIVMIDTPGIGSTLTHNTQAAEAILPEADVALFIVSPDPPVTQAEIDYLKAVQSHAVHTLVVLNKCDLMTNDERRASIAFLEQALAEAGLEHLGDILCVSARQGLSAKLGGDDDAAASSGVTGLETMLLDFLARQKRQALEHSFRRKAAGLLRTLALENDVVLHALELPVEELAGCAARLAQAMAQIALQRRQARDLIAGDKARLVEDLKSEADRLQERIEAALSSEINARIDAGENPERLARDLLDRLPSLFEEEFARVREQHRAAVAGALRDHEANAGMLAEAIGAAAASALGIHIEKTGIEIETDFDLAPAWFDRRRESLNPLPAGAFARLLPRGFAAARTKRRIIEEIAQAVKRNVEKLRWPLRQATETTFRQYERALDEQLDALAAGTGDAIGLAIARRQERSEGIAGEVRNRLAFRDWLERAIATAEVQPSAAASAADTSVRLEKENDAAET